MTVSQRWTEGRRRDRSGVLRQKRTLKSETKSKRRWKWVTHESIGWGWNLILHLSNDLKVSVFRQGRLSNIDVEEDEERK